MAGGTGRAREDEHSDAPAEGASLAPGVTVPASALRFSFARSAGPGGQNVNKLATKAELRIRLADLPISRRARERLAHLAGKRIVGADEPADAGAPPALASPPSSPPMTGAAPGSLPAAAGGRPPADPLADAELLIVSQSERSQARNRAECLEKLRDLLVRAMAEPKVRRKTRPTRGSVERRLTAKKSRGETKRRRRGQNGEE